MQSSPVKAVREIWNRGYKLKEEITTTPQRTPTKNEFHINTFQKALSFYPEANELQF